MTRSKSCFVHLCIVLLTVETILGVSAVSLRARRETQSEKDDEPRGESRAGGGKGGSHGETYENGNANDDSKSDDEKTDDGGWWYVDDFLPIFLSETLKFCERFFLSLMPANSLVNKFVKSM